MPVTALPRGRLGALASLSLVALLAAGAAVPTSFELAPGAVGEGVSVGRITLRTSLWGAAFAQSADTVRLDNVTLDLGFVTYRMPRMEFSGVNLSQGELQALLDPKGATPVAQRLARLSARQITIPELVTEQKLGQQGQSGRYRNVVASDVVQGRIATLSSESTSFEVKGGKDAAGKDKSAKGTFGRTSLTGLDLAAMARLYTQNGATPGEGLTPVYGGFSVETVQMTAEDGAEVRIARIAGRDFKAKPIKGSWAEIPKILAEMEGVDAKGEAEKQRVLGMAAELLGAFEVGSAEISAMEVRDPKGKEPTTGRIARIAYTGATGSQPSDARVEGIEITTKDGKAKIGTIAFTGFSFQSTGDAMRGMAEKPLGELDAETLRKLIPTIGTVRLSGLDFDMPNDKAAPAPRGQKPERIRFTIAGMELTADKPLNGVPTNLSYRLESFSMPIPAGSKESGLKELGELGYKSLDISASTAATWNEAGSELQIRDVSVRGLEMGRVTLKGVLGGVSKDVFDADSAIATVALLGATARTAEIVVENKGLFERLIAQQAKKQKKSPEDLRREFGMGAAVGIPAILGNSASAKAIGQAVARFVAKPGRLTLTAQTKDAAGLGVADLATVSEPSALLERLTVTAVAE